MSPRIVQFGTFQADLDSGELFREGIRLKLGGQPFQVLDQLLARPGEVVTREELRLVVWQSETFVDFDHGLNTAINKIRDALGDSASNPRFVETVPRRGYRFIAPVDRPVPLQPDPAPAPPPDLAAAPASAAAHLRGKIPSLKWIAAAAGVVVALAAGLILSRSRTPAAPLDYKLTQITRDSGLTFQPSISADGNFVVYASDRATGKDLDIWIQHVSGGQPVRLTSTPAHEFHPSISSDGRKVAFNASGEEPGIFVVPALGGTPKLVALWGGRAPQISPDGTSVAYSTGWYSRTSEIRVVSTEGGAARKVLAGLDWAMSPFWTQDGRHLLMLAGGPPHDYWIVPVSGGAATNTGAYERLRGVGVRPMLEDPIPENPFPTAAAGAGGVVIAALSGDGYDLWLSPLSGGKAASPGIRITVGAMAANPSVAANGRIAFSRLSVNSGLWMLPLEGSSGRVTGEMRRMWRETVKVAWPNVSADGKKLAYVSNRMGDPDVWVRNLETGADRQLTSSKADEFRAMISPDGGRVAFGVQGNFYTMPSGGGAETLVCEKCGTSVAGWSPDGGKLLYYRGKPIRHTTVDLTTGHKRDIVWHPTAYIWSGRISPDGRWISFDLVAEGRREIYVASLDDGGGGKPETWIRISGDRQPAYSSFWSPDGNLLYFLLEEDLWARKLRPDTKAPIGEAFLVQRFEGGRIGPVFSANGVTKDALYFIMRETTANIWLAEPSAR